MVAPLTGARQSPEFHFRARVFVKPGDPRVDDFPEIPGGGLLVPVYKIILADIEIGLGFPFPPFMRIAFPRRVENLFRASFPKIGKAAW